ncbi:hypothetical protein HHL22_18015 [Hymenobacter sp. RP-2-7]|uniref:Outer membrane protein beta-barrel domain-containing protein n=1 Tax=Hymenobacter polaris TaxID=2682546 RepID=A0A7Y0AGU4_9BACT|nr:hypothetical protein [Hymenobacter polaris]NML67106.1 hypothetical protein [Hymenobacter polaris]
MKHLLTLLAVAAAGPALAQTAPVATDSLPRRTAHHGRHCPCCCHCLHHKRLLTEQTNRLALLASLGATTDREGRAYAGFGVEIGRAVAPRLTVGGRGWLSAARSSATNYGYDATRPALSIQTLTGNVRYQLLNTQRWRLEAVGSLGAGAVQLYDRDQTVVSYGQYGRSEHAATVFLSVHPLLEGGAGLTYKVGREFWLSSRLGYQYLPGTSGLGAAGEFSGWQASLSATVPWGWH